MQKKEFFKQAIEKNKIVVAEKVLGKRLPFSLEAEKAVLGAILLNDSTLSNILEMLNPNDFYTPSNKTIFQAMLNISARNQRVDIVTLQDELDKMGQLDSTGGIVYLLSLQEEIPALGLIEQHAQIIKDKSILRDLISSATQIITNCYDQNDKEIESVLDEAEKVIFQISNKRANSNFVQLNIWLKKTFQHLSDIKGNSRGITGVASGYKKLDEMTSGFQKGDFVVLAARPSMGKTALALSIAHNAGGNNTAIGFMSLEMSAEQLALRLLSCDSGVSHQNIRNATITSDEWLELTHSAGRLSQLNIFIDDTAVQSIADVRAKARKLKIEHNMQFLIIDYLQLIHSHRKHENRHQEVSDISRSLKSLAKELGICFYIEILFITQIQIILHCRSLLLVSNVTGQPARSF